MRISGVDFGPSHPFRKPSGGQLVGNVMVEGLGELAYPRGGHAESFPVVFWARAWQAIGGQPAGSPAALKYLLRQFEEIRNNRDLQPCFIEWETTSEGSYSGTTLHDGWYVISGGVPDYQTQQAGIVKVQMDTTFISPAAPARFAIWHAGGALKSNASGAAQNTIWVPVSSTTLTQFSLGRPGAEGSIPGVLAPVPNPVPFMPGALVAQWFQGRVRVYDTLNTSSNPVPTTGGTFVHANWVEVFDSQHDFVGDCVITNGLLLLIFQANGGNFIFNIYLWNVALATANWQSAGFVWYQDGSFQAGTLRSYRLVRVSSEECSISTISSSPTPHALKAVIRLQRGAHHGYLHYTPLTQAMTHGNSLIFHGPAAPKILYNSGAIRDDSLGDSGPTAPTDYEFGPAFANSSAFPLIWGWLHQNQPGGFLPGGNGNSDVGQGDATSLAPGASRLIAFFAYPYGVSGSYSTANLQAEGESGGLGTGWSSVADAAASGGNTAKCANGTLTGNTDDNLFGVAQKYAPGLYRAWFRVRVASTASALAQMEFSIYDGTAASVLATGTIAPNILNTAYVWYSPGTFTVVANHNIHAYVKTAATLATDWFIDEVALVPFTTVDGANRGPQDLWQQFMYDREARLVRI